MTKKKTKEGMKLGAFLALDELCMFCEGTCAVIKPGDEYPQCCYCRPRNVELCGVCNGRAKKRDYKEEMLQATRKYGTYDVKWLSKKLDMPVAMVLKGIKWLKKHDLIESKGKDLRVRSKTRTGKADGYNERPRQTRLY